MNEAFLFGPSLIDPPWLEAFAAGMRSAPDWVARGVAAVEARYAADPAARDGFSRIAFGLWRTGDVARAVEFFERDWTQDRMLRWQFLRYLDALLAVDRRADAEARVADYYARHSEARDGWAVIAQYELQRSDDAARARALLERDRRAQRLSPAWLITLADTQARTGDLTTASQTIAEAYRHDTRLRDEHVRLIVPRINANDLDAQLAWYERDRAHGRLSPTASLDYACLLAHRAPTDAEAIVAQAYASDPKLRDGYLRIGLSLWQAGLTSSVAAYAARDLQEDRLSKAQGARAVYEWSREQGLRAEFGRFVAGVAKWLSRPVGLEIARALYSDSAFAETKLEDFVRYGLCRDRELRLRVGTITVPAGDVVGELESILVEEDGRFSTTEERPRIVDVGAGFGLFVGYLKIIHSEARIVALETDPALGALLEQNVARNRWRDVEVRRTGEIVAAVRECLPQPTDLLRLNTPDALKVLMAIRHSLAEVWNIHARCRWSARAGHTELHATVAALETTGFDVRLRHGAQLKLWATRGATEARR